MNPTQSFSIDVDALAREGIPKLHAEAFAQVAQQEKCIILTRVPGPACYDLLNEGYDAKSFHIKGKSCNWGPMAGFVCLDPLFNKSGIEGAVSNAKAHKKALTDKYEDKTAAYTPIRISADRLKKLIDTKVVQVVTDGTDRKEVKATYKKDPNDPKAITPPDFSFLLLKQGNGWRVYYRLEETYKTTDLSASGIVNAFTKLDTTMKPLDDQAKTAYETVAGILLKERGKESADKTYVPVMALTNPHPHYTTADKQYLNAVTGDYDLFALWPHKSRAGQDDQRVAGMSNTVTDKAIVQAEANNVKIGALVGNISNRIYTVAQLINSVISSSQPQPNRVYHSDEGGRPFVESVDLPVAVFLPASFRVDVPSAAPPSASPSKPAPPLSDYRPAPHGHIVDTPEKLVDLIVACSDRQYTVFVNKGWREGANGQPGLAPLLEKRKVGLSKVLADSDTVAPATK